MARPEQGIGFLHAAGEESRALPEPGATDLATILFTSGSTGVCQGGRLGPSRGGARRR